MTRTNLPHQVWIGSVLILVALSTFIAVQRWMSSRTFVAVDMPISLGRGKIKTGPFKVNLKGDYQIRIDTCWESYFDPHCPSYDRVKAHWVLYKDGHAVARWLEYDPYTYLGGFDGQEGTYKLDLEVLSDTACLDPGQPRLLVYTSKAEYESYSSPILWASAFGVVLGTSLVALGFIAFSAELHPQNVQISDAESIGQCFRWAQNLPLEKRFSSLPAFALVASPILVILVIVFMVILGDAYHSRGLYVHLLKPSHSSTSNLPLVQPIVIRIVNVGPGRTPDVYVNSKAASWEQLRNALKEELKTRPEWVVQVEGDPDVSWECVVAAIDAAKGLHARVVLLTSNTSQKARAHTNP